MHICIDLTSLADNLSGIERFAACISLEMIKTHSEETFTLVFKDAVHPLFDGICNNNNIKTIILPACNKLLFNQVRLPHAMKKINADWYLFLAFPVPILMFKKGMVETIHDITAWDYPETMKGIMNWYFKLSHIVALKKCKAIITISNFSKKRIHERLNYQENKIWLVYCGIDQEHLRISNEKKDYVRKKYNLPDRYILSLSTLEPRKNLPLLIHAYEELIKEGKPVAPLVLAGRKGWKMDELLASIDENVKKQLIFTGFVDDKDLPEVYSMADFFVFPSIYEGFGLPPLEAMACRTVVLSSNAASLPEVLGDAAIYFDSNQIGDLKKKIIEISTMPDDDYDRYVNLGCKQVDLFNWRKEAEKLYYLLESKK